MNPLFLKCGDKIMNHELKMRLAEIAAPKVYETLRYLYANTNWEDQPKHFRDNFIKQEYDVTDPIVDALVEVYTEGSTASRQLIELLST